MQTAVGQCWSQSAGSSVFLTRRLRAPCLFMRSLVLILFSFASLQPLAATDPFGEAHFIADLGANQLALEKIEQQQTRPELSIEDWLQWERLRIELYSKGEAWQTLIKRIDTQQRMLPAPARDWFVTQQADAWLALGDGQAARKILRQLIWLRETDVSMASLNRWREQLIRSYMLDNQANAAHTTMLRHNQDNRAMAKEATSLRARVLLQAGRPGDAFDLLEKNTSAPARSLSLLAGLRSAKLPAGEVVDKALAMINAGGLDKDVRIRLWAVVAEASRVENDTGQHADALEAIFADTRATQLDDGLVKLKADDLWQAYRQHAQAIGNRQQLLIGDDKKWFALAKKYKDNPLRQRTIYGFLTESAGSDESRLQAHEKLVNSLQERKDGLEVLRRLYLHAPRYAETDKLPAIVRYTLLEQALAESDLALASRMIAGLQQAPQGVPPLLWEMRRARVFIMAGDLEKGSELLVAVLNSETVLNKVATDRFMQVLFDLQTVNEHERAYSLFDKLLLQTGGPQLRREILYWMADSRKAQEQYAEAAVLYLRSADLPGESLPDLWAQSALYQAAEALTEAELISDARRIYSRLLKVSKDEARRAVLQRRLQQLWLRENKRH